MRANLRSNSEDSPFHRPKKAAASTNVVISNIDREPGQSFEGPAYAASSRLCNRQTTTMFSKNNSERHAAVM